MPGLEEKANKRSFSFYEPKKTKKLIVGKADHSTSSFEKPAVSEKPSKKTPKITRLPPHHSPSMFDRPPLPKLEHLKPGPDVVIRSGVKPRAPTGRTIVAGSQRRK